MSVLPFLTISVYARLHTPDQEPGAEETGKAVLAVGIFFFHWSSERLG